ncbi:MAG: deoxyribonuclease IV [Patescibacteria group bacterium]|jgi:deoxyribonuclease-4
MRIIGGHVSIAGGISKAVERAVEREFNGIQIFASAPQSYSKPSVSPEEIDRFNKLYKENNMQFLVFHAIYLLNLASEKPSLVHASIESLIGYMQFGEKINSTGTVFHIGSYKERTFDDVKEQLVTSFLKILEKTPSNQKLIIENAAGGGGRVGATLGELVYLHNEISSRVPHLGSRVKFCIDTQHLFATGVDTGNKEIFGKWLKEFDEKIGIEHLVCLHVNDSKTDLGSKHDRHENIGEGKIGIEGFKNIVHQPLLKNIPLILEVPGFDGVGPDKRNKDILEEIPQ